MITLRSALIAILCTLATQLAAAATFTFRSTDGPGEGFNDPTPFTPVGGNTATTLGQARMNLMNEAGRIWGSLLQSDIPILVDVAFDALTCSNISGTLGSAGPRTLYRNFGGGVSADTYYPSALADALAGRNVSNSTAADINATFNSAVDSDSNCLAGRGFYYGFDHNRGTRMDLLLVALHELSHGLGFSSDVDLTTGEGIVTGGVERFSIYTYMIFDEQLGLAWPAMSRAQRIESATRTGMVAWAGANTNAQMSRYSSGFTSAGRLRLHAPATVASGSSISHWDPIMTPSGLMEPNLPATITTSSTDVTVCALQDIGWQVTQCPHSASNRAPVANPQTVTVLEDNSITVQLTASDADTDPLTYAIAFSTSKGTLSPIDPVTHLVTFTPNANANGPDSFVFNVNDGMSTSNSAIVTINITPVNDAPSATDFSLIAPIGQTTNVTLHGSDVDGDSLTYTIMISPTHGVLTGSGASLSYRPDDGYTGPDSFTYRANDGFLDSGVATTSINVQTLPQVTASSASGGGGAMNLALLGLLSLLGYWRRVHPTVMRR